MDKKRIAEEVYAEIERIAEKAPEPIAGEIREAVERARATYEPVKPDP